MNGTECFSHACQYICMFCPFLGVDQKYYYSITSTAIQVVSNNADALWILPHIKNKCLIQLLNKLTQPLNKLMQHLNSIYKHKYSLYNYYNVNL